jgi:transcriptional regulator with XRE-family HTH domain
VPIRHITPSSHVGPQVRRFRTRRGWTQRDLVDRLHQLGVTATGWSQPKIHKLESGKLTRVLVDDVFELAAALDVSPLYLLTPLEPFDERDNALKVWIGGRLSFWPRDVRQWVRGVRPLLNAGDYPDDGAAGRGQRFYLLESQPLSEWLLLAKIGDYAGRVIGSIETLTPTQEGDDE